MAYFAAPIARLIEQFEKMPGIGHKTAQRLAFYVLNLSSDKAKALTDAISAAKEKISFCSVCQNLTDLNQCEICTNPKRDSKTICVVEDPKDVVAMEKTKEFHGLYHVLHGAISPMDNIGPDDIKLKELLCRVAENDVTEVIMATNPNIEGEATALYIAKLLKHFNVKVTRIAHGLPVGADIEYADEITLTRALEGRHEMEG